MIQFTDTAIQPDAVMVSFHNACLANFTVKSSGRHIFTTLRTYIRWTQFALLRVTLVVDQQRCLLFGDVRQIVFVRYTLHNMIKRRSLFGFVQAKQ